MSGYNCGICGQWFSSDNEAYAHLYRAHEKELRGINPGTLVREAQDVDPTVTGRPPVIQEEAPPRYALLFLLLFILLMCMIVIPVAVLVILHGHK